jgi:hypothetical protein
MALRIIKLYGNKTAHFAPEDIYSDREECLQDHPNDEVLEGFGVLDTETGFCTDDSDDWYETEEDAQEYIDGVTPAV